MSVAGNPQMGPEGRGLGGQIKRAGAFAVQFLLGPWPVQPVFVALLIFMVNQSAEVRLMQARGVASPFGFAAIASNALYAVLLGCALWIAVRLVGLASPGVRWARPRYLLAVALAVTLAQFVSQASGLFSNELVGYFLIRSFLAVLVIVGLFGIAQSQISRQRDLTQYALNQVEQQRELLLEADESARRDVAAYLHDTVQATLVVVGLQLRSLANDVPDEQAQRVRSLVDELETVRMRDIRSASRKLSPDIHAIRLGGALRELATSYEGTMRVELSCEVDAPDEQTEVALAVYRIVEQALLNAAIHGHPESCRVVVTREDQRAGARPTARSMTDSDELPILVSVTNDGLPMASDHRNGSGSAVVEAWVSRFKGSWTLESVDGQTRMSAILRIPEAGRLAG